jgi:hypothetical protein
MSNHHTSLRLQRRAWWLFAVTLVIALSSWQTIALADPWPTKPYCYFLHGVGIGQRDVALAQFADDAVVIAGRLCSKANPCVGRAQIGARYIVPMLARRDAWPMANARFDGQVLRAGPIPARGARVGSGDPAAVETLFEFRDGRISAVRAEPEAREQQMAELPQYRGAGAVAR